MQDVTKGVVKTYTGPTVINPTAQQRPVVFDAASGTFRGAASLEEAMRIAPVAAEGHYIIQRNPARGNKHPHEGSAQPSAEQEIGRTIIVPGPATFALWPGQSAEVVEGHHLRSNQYLLVRIYNEDEARKNWSQAVVKPAVADGDGAGPQPVTKAPPPDLTVGKQLIIRGTEVSFYIPPTGVEVVAEAGEGKYVREALTLERLEYAILVDENGKKRFEVGPQVVFPLPSERFVEAKDDTGRASKKFRAVELNEIQGLHIKVIADYVENGVRHRAGDELFLTGKETSIYFPREEHSIVRYDGRDKHFAVAVPAGEARYVMNRKTGEIRMVRGPAMLLPNPVDDVIVRRVLTDRECQTWYPGNDAVLGYNRSLRQLESAAPAGRAGVVSESEIQRQQKKAPAAQQVAGAPAASAALAGDVLDRANQFTQPRTVVLDTRFQGVPSVNTWVGYAVMVVDKQGGRRVEQGPINLLLGYDETLEVIQLSTGKPKTTDKLIETVFLRVLNNKVGDICVVETSDHVTVTLEYSMRVNFEGEPARWFEVENYVKFLCDHVRSVLKGAIKKVSIEAFYGASVEIIRDTMLGKAGDGGARTGMRFAENGMRITDVEILEVAIDDDAIAELLNHAQHEAVQSNITLLRAQRGLDVTRRQEQIARETADAQAETKRKLTELEIEQVGARMRMALAQIHGELDEAKARQATAVAHNAAVDVDHQAALARQRATEGIGGRHPRRQVLALEAPSPRSTRWSSGSARPRAASARRCWRCRRARPWPRSPRP
jgi:major vault protein